MPDLKAMSIAHRSPDVDTYMDVLERIIRAEPLNQHGVIHPLEKLKDSWQMSKRVYDMLPQVDWHRLHNVALVDVEVDGYHHR